MRNISEKEFVEIILKNKKEKENVGVYLVGGAVRDFIMKKPIMDKDYCVTGFSKEEFENIFPKAKKVGESYEIYLLNIDNDRQTEVALARREEKEGYGYHGIKAFSDKNITIEEDLFRRDLTINAIAYDLINKKLIDPFEGKKDIEKRKIKATSERFSEDPLRIIRAARFAARYGYEIEGQTVELCQKIKNELTQISNERFFLEFEKVVKDKKLNSFFYWAEKLGALEKEYCFDGKKYEGFFKEFSEICFNKNFKINMEKIKKMEHKEAIIFVFSQLDIPNVKKISKKWHIPNEIRDLVVFFLENKSYIKKFKLLDEKEKYTLIEKILKSPLKKKEESEFGTSYQWLKQIKNIIEVEEELLKEIVNISEELEKIKITKQDLELGMKGKEIGEFLKNKRIKHIKKRA